MSGANLTCEEEAGNQKLLNETCQGKGANLFETLKRSVSELQRNDLYRVFSFSVYLISIVAISARQATINGKRLPQSQQIGTASSTISPHQMRDAADNAGGQKGWRPFEHGEWSEPSLKISARRCHPNTMAKKLPF